MSLSWICWKPRMLDPSNPSPKGPSSHSVRLIEKCWRVPKRSQKRRSITRAPAFRQSSWIRSAEPAGAAGTLAVASGAFGIVFSRTFVFSVGIVTSLGLVRGKRKKRNRPSGRAADDRSGRGSIRAEKRRAADRRRGQVRRSREPGGETVGRLRASDASHARRPPVPAWAREDSDRPAQGNPLARPRPPRATVPPAGGRESGARRERVSQAAQGRGRRGLPARPARAAREEVEGDEEEEEEVHPRPGPEGEEDVPDEDSLEELRPVLADGGCLEGNDGVPDPLSVDLDLDVVVERLRLVEESPGASRDDVEDAFPDLPAVAVEVPREHGVDAVADEEALGLHEPGGGGRLHLRPVVGDAEEGAVGEHERAAGSRPLLPQGLLEEPLRLLRHPPRVVDQDEEVAPELEREVRGPEVTPEERVVPPPAVVVPDDGENGAREGLLRELGEEVVVGRGVRLLHEVAADQGERASPFPHGGEAALEDGDAVLGVPDHAETVGAGAAGIGELRDLGGEVPDVPGPAEAEVQEAPRVAHDQDRAGQHEEGAEGQPSKSGPPSDGRGQLDSSAGEGQ